MDENEALKKKIIKRKLSHHPVTGVVLPFNGGAKPNMARNGILSRKTLNPQAYEASAVKQMQSYKQTKSMELFKERGMKFTCVDSSQQKAEESSRIGLVGTSTSLASIATVSACHVSMMDPRDREAINFYEGERNGGRETERVGANFTDERRFGETSVERTKNFGFFPRFDPRVPPPQIGQPKQTMAENEPAQRKRQIKQESAEVEEVTDEIPSFQYINPHTSDSASSQTSHSDVQSDEIEEKKKRLHLLWSICQEELTVDADLEKTAKELAEMRRNFDAMAKAIKAKEKSQGIQKMRKKRIDERKKMLLTGAGMGEEQLTMRQAKQETEKAERTEQCRD